jgi:threonyl-tRNA synthetase
VEQEALDYFKLQLGVYRDLGFDKISVKLALRPGPNERLGSDDIWDRAENLPQRFRRDPVWMGVFGGCIFGVSRSFAAR